MDQQIPAGCLPFDLEKALAGAPLITRDGRRVLRFEEYRKSEGVDAYPYSAVVAGFSKRLYFTPQGRYVSQSSDDDCDLFLVDAGAQQAALVEASAPLNDGGPAFPGKVSVLVTRRNFSGQVTGQITEEQAVPGMNLRQHAAITLRVPSSGTDWLDDMIREARRLDAVEAAANGYIASFAGMSSPITSDKVTKMAGETADVLVVRGGAA